MSDDTKPGATDGTKPGASDGTKPGATDGTKSAAAKDATRKQLAKDIAREMDRSRRRRKMLLLVAILALIAAAILLLGFGKGWGLFGKGPGKGKGEGPGSGAVQPAAALSDAGPQRCTLRVAADGIFVDGNKLSRDEAVAACKKTEGAMVTVTGDARQGDWDELRAALQAVGVKIYIRGELWDGSASVRPEDGSAAPAPGSNSP